MKSRLFPLLLASMALVATTVTYNLQGTLGILTISTISYGINSIDSSGTLINGPDISNLDLILFPIKTFFSYGYVYNSKTNEGEPTISAERSITFTAFPNPNRRSFRFPMAAQLL
jgi:hypothetical protein